MPNVCESSIRFTVSESRHAICDSKHYDRDDGSECHEQKTIVEVEVDHAANRKNPGEVEVEHLHAIEKSLVDVWVGDVRHGYELLRNV